MSNKKHSKYSINKGTYTQNLSINRNTQLRFWEIDNHFKCPVVGMCLTFSEQKQILKKAGISVKNKSPFDIHELLVASSEKESRLSRRVDNLLNRKFGKQVTYLLGLGHEEFKEHFKASFRAGNCIPVSWAAAINPELPTRLRKEIFGDIHMAMHWSGEQGIKLKKMLAKQQEELDELRRSIKEATKFRRTVQKENRRLTINQAKLRTSLAAVENDKKKLEEKLSVLDNRYRFAEIEKENRILKGKLDDLLRSTEERERQLVSLKEENLRLSLGFKQQQDSNQRFKREAQDIIRQVVALSSCNAACPSFDLCKKRILIVGGITRMESLYRELIESHGGIFEYHDGYMKKGVKKLEYCLRRADVVVCPVNCNSHAACSTVKNLAKKHNKTVHMLANSSLSAVTQVIWGGNVSSTIN